MLLTAIRLACSHCYHLKAFINEIELQLIDKYGFVYVYLFNDLSGCVMHTLVKNPTVFWKWSREQDIFTITPHCRLFYDMNIYFMRNQLLALFDGKCFFFQKSIE